MKTATIGSISSGTMRNEDLAKAFLAELDYLEHPYAALYRRDWEINVSEDETDEELASALVHAMFEALDECAPPYVYFGAHFGDGADYGFWPCDDAMEMAADDGCQIVSDLADVKHGEVFIITDHGNVTYGFVDADGFHEVWSCV